jgi:glycosyltransferase involved in cell wall biosynthesis
MHIAFISYEYPPDTPAGGMATYVYQAARVLQHRGHQVELFVGSPCRSDTHEEDGIAVHRLKVSERAAYPEIAGAAFAARHRAAPFDVLEGPDFWAEARVAVALTPSIPLVVRLHTPQFLVHRVRDARLSPDRRARMRRQAARRHTVPRWNPFSPLHDAERQHLLDADEIVGISGAITETLTRLWQLPSDRISRIPNPYTPASALLAIPLETQTRAVTFVGRLEVRKGVVALAAAIPRVLRARPDVTFRFVGRAVPIPPGMRRYGAHPGTDMADYLAARLAAFRDRVEFAGPITVGELPGTLARTDLCIFPSLWENFPYVCLEAMAAGRGVIGSRAGGMPEMLADGNAGLLVHPDNPREMAAAMLRLLDDPALRMRLGQSARQRVLTEYNADRIGVLMEASYARAIAHRREAGPRTP